MHSNDKIQIYTFFLYSITLSVEKRRQREKNKRNMAKKKNICAKVYIFLINYTKVYLFWFLVFLICLLKNGMQIYES